MCFVRVTKRLKFATESNRLILNNSALQLAQHSVMNSKWALQLPSCKRSVSAIFAVAAVLVMYSPLSWVRINQPFGETFCFRLLHLERHRTGDVYIYDTNCRSVATARLTFKNRASYIQDGRTATLQMLHFIYFFNNYKF